MQLLTGCDPTKVLVVKAKQKGTSVAVYTSTRIMPRSKEDDSAKIIIQVPSNETRTRKIRYGMGWWSDDAIAAIATDIDSIVMVKGEDRIVFGERMAIEDFLKKHRSGYGDAVLTIKP